MHAFYNVTFVWLLYNLLFFSQKLHTSPTKFVNSAPENLYIHQKFNMR